VYPRVRLPDALVRRALARCQDLIASADTGSTCNRKDFFFAHPSPVVNAPQAGRQWPRMPSPHTSAYVSILEIVLALGSCLDGLRAFSRLHVCVCGESRAEH
jgi:hypothetical protein